LHGVDLDEFCQKHSFDGWRPTSAKDATNVDDAVNLLVGIITKSVCEYQNKFFNGQIKREDVLKLGEDDDNEPEEKPGKCCGN